MTTLMTAFLPLLTALARAAVVSAVPLTGAPVSGAWSGAVSLPSTPLTSLSAPMMSAPTLGSMLPAAMSAPIPVPAIPAAAAELFSAAAPGPSAVPAAEAVAFESQARFDGAAAKKVDMPAGWSQGSFASAVDGLPVAYKSRPGSSDKAPRVYSGGLALNESFDALFARPGDGAAEYFPWSRGHAPTGWKPQTALLDADARDLARMIVGAARETGSAKVELVLHSFGTVVFQRLVQLREDPEVRAALKLLAGSRVVMLNGMTHYDRVEDRGGPEVKKMAQAMAMLVQWLDSWDALAAGWQKAKDASPFPNPVVETWLWQYRQQRDQLLAMATQEAVKRMRADLEQPGIDAALRKRFLKDLERDAANPDWQEALLRRSHASFSLDFKTADVAFLRRLGVKLDLYHSLHDQLLDWTAAQVFAERLGIPLPAQAPAPGTVMKDATGRLRLITLDADHYLPLKQPETLEKLLAP